MNKANTKDRELFNTSVTIISGSTSYCLAPQIRYGLSAGGAFLFKSVGPAKVE
jgi:hypothetical protein